MASEVKRFGHVREVMPPPNLMKLQVESYARFLQVDLPSYERAAEGLEGILQEIFPIESYNGEQRLEYLGYDLGRPRYSPDDCRKLRQTYGMPFKIRVRLAREGQANEEDVYLGEIPMMIGGGEFLINGSERVIVSQLHRSPGVDFDKEIHASDKILHKCRIIPERGSWIEVNVSKRDALTVRIDQSGKFPVTCLLRALFQEYATNEDIIRLFYETETVDLRRGKGVDKITGKVVVSDIIDPNTGEEKAASGTELSEQLALDIKESGCEKVEVVKEVNDWLVLNTLKEDGTSTHEEALLKIYLRLRPGNPPQLDKARQLVKDKFFNDSKYRLGKVGRFRINRKFGLELSQDLQTLGKEDFISAIRYIVRLRDPNDKAELDDIDHLGNRRIKTIDELAGDEFRKGFLKLKRTVQERMTILDDEKITPRSIINSKTISSAIDYFFGRGELSQVVDQTNPLSQLTHERRLSALGPGGLNRKRASFEVRDVHISHYGRICPIETPEGTNIGLIASLSIYATLDEYGFLVSPYQVVKKGKVTGDIAMLRADEEDTQTLAPADVRIDAKGKIVGDAVMARVEGEFVMCPPKQVEYIDISPRQLIGISASLIPFLEHNDANRALMGSNMQRQAVPLLVTDPPVIATGMEKVIAGNSGMVVRALRGGVVSRATAELIEIDNDDVYMLRKYVGLNEKTCQNQKPIVRVGEKVKKGQVLADGAATKEGELALGKNVLAAFLSYDGYNFEDAIVISEELLHEDTYTSIHINEFQTEIRETKLGREEFTRDIPNVSEKALRNLSEEGIVQIGTKVTPGDILVGKVVPKNKSELSPEEKLLHAIFGRMGEDVKNESLEVPSGVAGIVIEAQKFCRKAHLTDDEKRRVKHLVADIEERFERRITEQMTRLVNALEGVAGGEVLHKEGGLVGLDLLRSVEPRELRIYLEYRNLKLPGRATRKKVRETVLRYAERIEDLDCERERKRNRLLRGDELETGVLELVKVYVATKRTLSVGDKMAGRHGNKGVIAKIVPKEDMPFLPDGTPVQILLNPLGVPSRMNVGQIMETHLGWAARTLGFQAVTPVFDGASEGQIRKILRVCDQFRDGEVDRDAALKTVDQIVEDEGEDKIPEEIWREQTGKMVLRDGRTGERLDQEVTVGYMYMLKLHHLVDEKVHARATGPYSLITQQPLGGKARFGGQRFGEMEVWALEAYGASSVLQELLTVKSDDVDGRTKIYESMVKGENVLEPGTPVSFDVLCNEIKGLGLNIELKKKRV